MAGQAGPKTNSNNNPTPDYYLNPTNIRTDGTYIKDVPYNNSFSSTTFNYLENKTDLTFVNSKQVYYAQVVDFQSAPVLASGTLIEDGKTVMCSGRVNGIYVGDTHFVHNITLNSYPEPTVVSTNYDGVKTYIEYNSVIGEDSDICESYLKFTYSPNRDYKTFDLSNNSPIINSSTNSFTIYFFCKPDFSKSYYGYATNWQNPGFYKRHRRSYLIKFRSNANKFSVVSFGFFAPYYRTSSVVDYKYKFDEICFAAIFRNDGDGLNYNLMTDLLYKSNVWNFVCFVYDYNNRTVQLYINGELVNFYNSVFNPILKRPVRNINNCVHRRNFLDYDDNTLSSQNSIGSIAFNYDVDNVLTPHKEANSGQSQNTYMYSNYYNEFGRLFIYNGVALQPNQIQLLYKNYREQYLM